ncbi:hypothetical protein PENANT_c145G07857 [Penicillium antarcticum]|uniref:Uncharacterized protein n=1 Tax=Penicillium antarcticum TaxID=416450 RepID=A0A1V6PFK5_9EURO|nr:hypothetical protein PENANT_c145G07857 [Penicillium antarcticum]
MCSWKQGGRSQERHEYSWEFMHSQEQGFRSQVTSSLYQMLTQHWYILSELVKCPGDPRIPRNKDRFLGQNTPRQTIATEQTEPEDKCRGDHMIEKLLVLLSYCTCNNKRLMTKGYELSKKCEWHSASSSA